MPEPGNCPRRPILSTSPSSSPPTSHISPTPRCRSSAWRSAPPAIAARRSIASFNEAHMLAITQAICEYRAAARHRRPAVPRHRHARAVRARLRQRAGGAGRQRRRGHAGRQATNTRRRPVISHAILSYNRGRKTGLADGIVITPSHNPPETAASSTTRPTAARRTRDITAWIEKPAPTSCSPRSLEGVEAGAARQARSARLPRTGTTTSPATSPTWAT